MKKLLCIYVLILFSMNYLSAQKKEGTVEIFFPKETKGYVTIHESVPNYDENATTTHKYITLDSTKIVNNKYIYNYRQRDPDLVYWGIYQDSTYIPIYIENPYLKAFSNVTYLDNSHSIIRLDSIFKTKNGKTRYTGTINGSQETDIFFKLLNDKFNPKEQYQYTHPESGYIVNFDIIRDHPDSEYLLSRIYEGRNSYSQDSLQMALNCFDKKMQATSFGKKIISFIKYKKLFSEEGISQDFNFYDIYGNKYTFNDCNKGKKATLIVFWASWCGPCIDEIPHLQKLYGKYKDKVSFVSLSIDKNNSRWIAAVKRYGFSWPSLAGFPESPTKVSDIFGISFVPCFLLVDSMGNLLIDGSNAFSIANVNGTLRRITLANIDTYFDAL